MRDTQLCSQIRGIAKRRKVTGVPVSLADDEVEVTVANGPASWFTANAASRAPARTSASGLAPSGHRPAEDGSGGECRRCGLNAVILGADNSLAGNMNSRIKTVRIRARGFRNKQSFRNAIDFHLGGLQLYPEGIKT